MSKLTHRERFIMALECRQPPGLVPHFELVFYLTMEAFGKVHPAHRRFHQWGQMSRSEKRALLDDAARVYLMTADHYDHSAIFLHGVGDGAGKEEEERLINTVHHLGKGEYFLMIHGDATYSIPNGTDMMEWCGRIADDPQGLKDEAQRKVDAALKRAEWLRRNTALDGFAMCDDYCLNEGPFLSPEMFADYVGPYLAQLIAGYREMGFYCIKHTDGNIMPIIDQLVAARPHALHSLDPQGGVDIAEIKRRYGKQLCLVGNVNCGLLDTGTDEQVIESARYCLRHGMPGGGYIFSTSNCIYTGMDLDRYHLILDVWKREGWYDRHG
jgi:uroporphyrinogen decarboxylase